MGMGYPRLGWSGVRKLPSGKFQARWAIPGDEHTGYAGETFITKEQARAYARTKALEILDVKAGTGTIRKPMDEAVADFTDRNLNPQTLELYARHMQAFVAAFPDNPAPPSAPLPKIVYADQIADDRYINRFDKILAARGCNPGGRNLALRIVRTFCNYAMRKERRWLASYPFEGFKMPESDFQGRPVTPEEYALILAPTVGRMNQHALDETDRLLNLAFRLGRGMIVRISQVWKLTAADFREPGEVFVQGIKDQAPEWKPLAGDALAVMRLLLASTPRGQRFFTYFGSVQSFRNSIEDKVRRSGVKPTWDDYKKRWAYPRFHDICKVSAVSELAGVPGISLADLENVTNTSAKTLMRHYIKADKQRSYAKYHAYLAGRADNSPTPAPRADTVPTSDRNMGDMAGQGGTPAEISGTGVTSNTPFNLAEKPLLDEAI